jgi:hypothetical protein
MSGITMDASVNAMLGQSQAMSQANLETVAQVKLAKGVNEMQKNAVMTLISSAGLSTYSRAGEMTVVTPKGMQVNTIA